jgi:DHA1 family multidrug resistance protein-like MFS transporter
MCIVSSIGFVSTLATSIYALGHAAVAQEFGVSHTCALLPLSSYALGMGFGPMIASPLSETLGRKAVYLATVPLFTVFVLGAGFSSSIGGLCACRLFAGVFGAPGVSIASATIADIVPAERRGVPLAVYYAVPFLGSLLGPMIGGGCGAVEGVALDAVDDVVYCGRGFPARGFHSRVVSGGVDQADC